MKKKKISAMVISAILLAMQIVLSRQLSIQTSEFKIGFGFVPIVIAAILYGPLGGAIVAGLGDFLGALLFPVGAYFPGFTATAVLTGSMYGILKKRRNFLSVLLVVISQQIIGSLLLNTLWVSILYGSPFFPVLLKRLFQAVVMSITQVVIILVLDKGLLKRVKYLVTV